MTRWLLLFLAITLLLFGHSSKGQTDSKKIIASFDTIDFYPDSTIKCAYKIKKGFYNGYAIEFDVTGQVLAIGKYKSGKKHGRWEWRSGAWTTYNNGQADLIAVPHYDYLPDKQKAKDNFQKLYLKLIRKRGK